MAEDISVPQRPHPITGMGREGEADGRDTDEEEDEEVCIEILPSESRTSMLPSLTPRPVNTDNTQQTALDQEEGDTDGVRAFDQANKCPVERPRLRGSEQRVQEVDQFCYDGITAPIDTSYDLDQNAQSGASEATGFSLLGFTLDGVVWGGGKQYTRKFTDAFSQSLRNVDINGSEKLLLEQRFVNLARMYKKEQARWTLFSGMSRVIITVGSIVVPTLVIIDDEITERSHTSQILAYTVFTISLLVSIVNGLQELFSATKHSIAVSSAREALEAEGWSFLSLSGKYRGFETHADCLRYFVNRVERIHLATVNLKMSLARKPADDNGGAAHSSGNNNNVAHVTLPPGSVDGGMSSSESGVGVPVVYANH